MIILLPRLGISLADRLSKWLTPAQAARLREAIVEDMLESLQSAFPPPGVEIVRGTAMDAASTRRDANQYPQPVDWGARLFSVLCRALDRGYSQALVVVAEAPDLPPSHVEELMHAETDVSLGPAEEGGVWGIACRRLHPAMFEGVRWGSPMALEDTLHAARHYGLSVAVGSSWREIQNPAELSRLLHSPHAPRRTACLLRLWETLLWGAS